jgi:GAF domain-containing protein
MISTRFINLASDQIDLEINGALREIGEFIGADRSYIFLFSADGTMMDNTHEWCAAGIEPQIQHLQGILLSARCSDLFTNWCFCGVHGL